MTGVEAGRHRAAAHGSPDSCGPDARTARRPLAERILVPVVPAIAGLITGLYQIGVPPLWRDEAATKAIASRSVGQILATMPHDDVVHGAYYLVVHVFIRLFGSSNATLRLPSAIAVSVACAFTALVAQRLAASTGRPPGTEWPAGTGYGAALAGVTAGGVLALLPAMIRYAQESRSYAIVTMLAAIATYLLLRAVEDGRPRWWIGYGAAVFLTGLFNIFGLLILVSHGLTLLAVRHRGPAGGRGTAGRRARGRRLPGLRLRWLAAGVAACLVLVPLVALAYAQRNALSWMSGSPQIGRDATALTHFWAGSPGLVWPVFGLAAFGVAASLVAGPRALSPATVALPWLVAPPAILLAVSTAHPVYDQRYVEFCLGGLAICAGSGITWLWRLADAAAGRLAPHWSGSGRTAAGWLACLPAVAAAVALALALQPADAVVRQPGDRPDDLEAEAQIIAANSKPGDIVFFIPINDRIVSMPFPGPWLKLRDIALADSPVSSDTLYGTDVSPAELLTRFTHVTRVWVVSSSEVPEAAYLASPQATPLDREEFALVATMRQVHRWRDGDTELTLYDATGRS